MNQDQFQRMSDLNTELLSCTSNLLRAIREYCEKYHIPIKNDPKIDYLVGQGLCLIDEINGTNNNNRQLTRRNTTDKLPEPDIRFCTINGTFIDYFSL